MPSLRVVCVSALTTCCTFRLQVELDCQPRVAGLSSNGHIGTKPFYDKDIEAAISSKDCTKSLGTVRYPVRPHGVPGWPLWATAEYTSNNSPAFKYGQRMCSKIKACSNTGLPTCRNNSEPKMITSAGAKVAHSRLQCRSPLHRHRQEHARRAAQHRFPGRDTSGQRPRRRAHDLGMTSYSGPRGRRQVQARHSAPSYVACLVFNE